MKESTPNSEELRAILEGCLKSDRKSQELLYKQFFGFGMGVCLRYAKSKDEALEVLNDSFLKIFNKLESFDFSKPFIVWIKRIIINTAIDNYRSQQKHYFHQEIEELQNVNSDEETAEEKLNYEDLLNLVKRLPYSYQLNFNLYIIEGHTHDQISKLMEISAGTSKSNVSRAREMLRKMIEKRDLDKIRFL